MEVHVYKDKAGKWRWRKVAANGRITDASTQGFKDYAYCLEQAEENADGEPVVGPDETRRIEPKHE